MQADLTPTIDEFRPVVLRVLADGQTRRVRDVCELVADHMGLTAEVRAEMITSGQLRYVNRISWACSALTHAGLLERPSRGNYAITADGRTVDARSLTSYSEQDMLEWPTWRDYQAELAARKSDSVPGPVVTESGQIDPIEVMGAAERDFNAQVEAELLANLKSSSPEFFEKAVIDVLWAMGYGGDYGEKQHVGRTGDGGVDGIIRQDALGLSNIYVQAKRYTTNSVGSGDIRDFMGAMDTRGASQGVFITASTFAPAAKETARNYRHGKIVLIDGLELTSLMLRYGVAVHKTREFALYEIDEDYFEAELA
ncbi:restriction endonuclease [Actinomyces urogenitalis]|nr:restriction endonuclease [Actinomyces urogenitalis]MDU6852803.1 restriction endonuclease [Cutibacterium avidum]MDU0865386.1 restriction endonuclease [Actinomyces urogenitalis]MDU0875838.1 restriction endonuclease [Actinomyces urogenitalis]MDU1565539.1 restriction endonuclease [Actinomyces urogenitalis]MDU1640907.1 restriction endonuclease [Actinomyces urogenitalis]